MCSRCVSFPWILSFSVPSTFLPSDALRFSFIDRLSLASNFSDRRFRSLLASSLSTFILLALDSSLCSCLADSSLLAIISWISLPLLSYWLRTWKKAETTPFTLAEASPPTKCRPKPLCLSTLLSLSREWSLPDPGPLTPVMGVPIREGAAGDVIGDSYTVFGVPAGLSARSGLLYSELAVFSSLPSRRCSPVCRGLISGCLYTRSTVGGLGVAVALLDMVISESLKVWSSSLSCFE